jgi:hypothetical protein
MALVISGRSRCRSMRVRSFSAGSAVLLATGLLAGCGSANAPVAHAIAPAPEAITKAQAVAYTHAVNLRAGDLPGFSTIGSEAEAPEPGRYGRQAILCSRGVNSPRRIVQVHSAEFTAGRALYGEVLKSTVEVWPTPALVALNNVRSHNARGQRCLKRFLEADHKQINRERDGREQIGPFTITIVPNPLPGVSHSFLMTINETRLLRTGPIRAHIYRDVFGFIAGPAEIELEAIGLGHPVPTPAEAKALLVLLDRATGNASHFHRRASS